MTAAAFPVLTAPLPTGSTARPRPADSRSLTADGGVRLRGSQPQHGTATEFESVLNAMFSAVVEVREEFLQGVSGVGIARTSGDTGAESMIEDVAQEDGDCETGCRTAAANRIGPIGVNDRTAAGPSRQFVHATPGCRNSWWTPGAIDESVADAPLSPAGAAGLTKQGLAPAYHQQSEAIPDNRHSPSLRAGLEQIELDLQGGDITQTQLDAVSLNVAFTKSTQTNEPNAAVDPVPSQTARRDRPSRTIPLQTAAQFQSEFSPSGTLAGEALSAAANPGTDSARSAVAVPHDIETATTASRDIAVAAGVSAEFNTPKPNGRSSTAAGIQAGWQSLSVQPQQQPVESATTAEPTGPASGVYGAALEPILGSTREFAPIRSEMEIASATAGGEPFDSLDGFPTGDRLHTGGTTASSTAAEVKVEAEMPAGDRLIALPIRGQITDSIVTRARFGRHDGDIDFQMQLDPPELGTIRVHLIRTEEGLIGRITAAESVTSEMIENQLVELRRSLSNAGVEVSGFDVAHEGDRGREQPGSSQSARHSDRSGRSGAEPQPSENHRSHPTANSSGSRQIDVIA